VRWDEALPLIEKITAEKSLRLEGVMSHFLAIGRDGQDVCQSPVRAVQRSAAGAGTKRNSREAAAIACNSGGFLDLPHAHLDMGAVGDFALRRFPVAGLPADPRHRTGDVGEGENRGDPEIEARRSCRLRDALHRAVRAAHRDPAHPAMATAFRACETKAARSFTDGARR